MRQTLTLKRARTLRTNMTDAERKLWFILRDRRFEDYKFRRQHPVGSYILDFACPAEKLVVELDGGQHCENKHDEVRTRWLEAGGWNVIRFWNNEVFENTEGVLLNILETLRSPSPACHRFARQAPSPPSEERAS